MLRAQARASFHALEQRSSLAVAHRVQAAFISSSAGRTPTSRRQNLISTPPSSSSAFPVPVRSMSTHFGESAVRPEPDKVVQEIADYVHSYKIDSDLAWETARLCLIDTIGCGLEGLRFPECQNLLGPVVEGTVVPNGECPGRTTSSIRIRGAFNIGTIIRWLDFNDCFLAAEWGHPSDNLGAILAVADHLARQGQHVTVKDVLEGMIKAHEIQGGLALLNSFNRVGLDHVVLVKVASTAVVSKLLHDAALSSQRPLTRANRRRHLTGSGWTAKSLRTYRHAPNTGSRKSWAAGDACSRAVNLAYLTWGFYDVLFKGKPFEFQRPFSSYVMENVLFKISYPAEFHAQTAVEAAHIVHERLKALGKTSDDIKSVRIRTQEAAVRIIDKQGPLDNFADRDHAINYMVAYPLIHGYLNSESYTDNVEYHDADKRSIGNALLVELNDGTVLDEVEVEYPVGHKRRREEGTPLLLAKFRRHIGHHFDQVHQKKILDTLSDAKSLWELPADKFTDLFVKP
ncbi:2-methylcitrate dehydratase [Lactarius sanguifluus]|nr:2-methylcitrate dehydratase [Lactarius sanguifluus]